MRITTIIATTLLLPALAAQQPAARPRIESIPSMRAQTQPADARHKSSYTLKVEPTDWVDTGITVLANDELTFTATGTLTLPEGKTATPDGNPRGWRDMLRQFPLDAAPAGSLIGRISANPASVPFLIGASSTFTAPQTGHLYLRANLTEDLAATGSYSLKLTFANTPKRAAAPVAAVASDLTQTLPPALFDAIPRRVEDQQHNPGDVVNFALIGTEEQVTAAFERSGWNTVDKSVQEAVVNGLLATLQHKAYTQVPMSTLYLFNRPQDLSYARADAITVAVQRHHLRLWKTDQIVNGKPLWVGSSTYDNGLEEDQRNGKMTHSIDPDIDQERDFIRQSFDASGSFASAAYLTPLDPVTTAKTATGGHFHTDGRILVLSLN